MEKMPECYFYIKYGKYCYYIMHTNIILFDNQIMQDQVNYSMSSN